jgi:hypothetical protein
MRQGSSYEWKHKPPMGTPLDPDWAAELRCNGFWPFNEGCGTKINDVSNNKYLGTFTGQASPQVQWKPGRNSQSLVFNGSTQFVNHGTAPCLYAINSDVTFVTMVNPTAFQSNNNFDDTGLFEYGQSANVIYSLTLVAFGNPGTGNNNTFQWQVQDSGNNYNSAASATVASLATDYLLIGTLNGMHRLTLPTISLYVYNMVTGKVFATGSGALQTSAPVAGGSGFTLITGKDIYNTDTSRFFSGKSYFSAMFGFGFSASQAAEFAENPWVGFLAPITRRYYIPSVISSLYVPNAGWRSLEINRSVERKTQAVSLDLGLNIPAPPPIVNPNWGWDQVSASVTPVKKSGQSEVSNVIQSPTVAIGGFDPLVIGSQSKQVNQKAGMDFNPELIVPPTIGEEFLVAVAPIKIPIVPAKLEYNPEQVPSATAQNPIGYENINASGVPKRPGTATIDFFDFQTPASTAQNPIGEDFLIATAPPKIPAVHAVSSFAPFQPPAATAQNPVGSDFLIVSSPPKEKILETIISYQPFQLGAETKLFPLGWEIVTTPLLKKPVQPSVIHDVWPLLATNIPPTPLQNWTELEVTAPIKHIPGVADVKTTYQPIIVKVVDGWRIVSVEKPTLGHSGSVELIYSPQSLIHPQWGWESIIAKNGVSHPGTADVEVTYLSEISILGGWEQIVTRSLFSIPGKVEVETTSQPQPIVPAPPRGWETLDLESKSGYQPHQEAWVSWPYQPVALPPPPPPPVISGAVFGCFSVQPQVLGCLSVSPQVTGDLLVGPQVQGSLSVVPI